MDTAIIAQHLNILESAIVKVESWANCLFVVARGLGAKFVSKSILYTFEPSNTFLDCEDFVARDGHGYVSVRIKKGIINSVNASPALINFANAKLQSICAERENPVKVEVSLKKSVFKEALKLVRAVKGQYDPNCKTWTIDRRFFNPTFLELVSVSDNDPNDDLDYAMYHPNGRYYG